MSTGNNVNKVSVNKLIEFCAKTGDLMAQESDAPSFLDGIMGHKKIQLERNDPWQSEYAIKYLFDDIQLEVQGRIDVVNPANDPPTIEEIKTTFVDPDLLSEDKVQSHWAQVKVYSALYLLNFDKHTQIHARVSWYNLVTDTIHSHDQYFYREELINYLRRFVCIYSDWIKKVTSQFQRLKDFCSTADFPYKTYRQGQYEFAKQSYRAIRDKQQLLVQAPTGVGKTVSALFPALKALSEGKVKQIVYLTAKGSHQHNAIQTLTRIANTHIDYVILRAKALACPCRLANHDGCDTDGKCSRTIGFFDRLPQARETCFKQRQLDFDSIAAIAEQFHLCPFELSLQMIPWSTVIVCDYNYFLDPLVQLAAFKNNTAKRVVIIDEIHNLVDRSRDMYSAELSSRDTKQLGQLLTHHSLKKPIDSLARKLEAINENEDISSQPPEIIDKAVENFIRIYHAEGDNILGADLLGDLPTFFPDWIKTVYRYYAIRQIYSDAHVTHVSHRFGKNNKDTSVALRCLNAANFLSECYKLCRTVIGFSATLSPFEFYQQLLGLQTDVNTLALPAVFSLLIN